MKTMFYGSNKMAEGKKNGLCTFRFLVSAPSNNTEGTEVNDVHGGRDVLGSRLRCSNGVRL